jgi:hypothetical protein
VRLGPFPGGLSEVRGGDYASHYPVLPLRAIRWWRPHKAALVVPFLRRALLAPRPSEHTRTRGPWSTCYWTVQKSSVRRSAGSPVGVRFGHVDVPQGDAECETLLGYPAARATPRLAAMVAEVIVVAQPLFDGAPAGAATSSDARANRSVAVGREGGLAPLTADMGTPFHGNWSSRTFESCWRRAQRSQPCGGSYHAAPAGNGECCSP